MEQGAKKKTFVGTMVTIGGAIIFFFFQWGWGEYWAGIKDVRELHRQMSQEHNAMVRRVETLEREKDLLKEKLNEERSARTNDNSEIWTAWGKHQTILNGLEVKSGVVEGLVKSYRLERVVSEAVMSRSSQPLPVIAPIEEPSKPPSVFPPPKEKSSDYEKLLEDVDRIEEESKLNRDPNDYKKWIQQQRIQQFPNQKR